MSMSPLRVIQELEKNIKINRDAAQEQVDKYKKDAGISTMTAHVYSKRMEAMTEAYQDVLGMINEYREFCPELKEMEEE